MFGRPQRASVRMPYAQFRLAERARPISAGNRMAAATALVHAATWRFHTKHATHSGQGPPTTALCEQGHARRPPAIDGAEERAASQRGEQVHHNAAARPAAQCCTCRAQRGLGKHGREWAGRGRHSGTGKHAGAPEATGPIGNPAIARRLRAVRACPTEHKSQNLRARFHKKSPKIRHQTLTALIVTAVAR
jgi:hypothetical protein